jgi:hypothetical protein
MVDVDLSYIDGGIKSFYEDIMDSIYQACPNLQRLPEINISIAAVKLHDTMHLKRFNSAQATTNLKLDSLQDFLLVLLIWMTCYWI